MKYKIIATLLAMSQVIFAYENPSDPHQLDGQGSLIALRMVMGKKQAKIFFVGQEAAQLSLEKDAKILSITALDDSGAKEELRFSPGKGFYTVERLPELKSPYRFSIVTQVKEKSETIEIKVKAPKPR